MPKIPIVDSSIGFGTKINILCGAQLVIYVYLALFDKIAMSIMTLFFVFVHLAWYALYIAIRQMPDEEKTLRRKFILSWVVVVSLAASAVSPIFEDDYFRYLWDGYLVANFYNPYVWPPADFFGKTLSTDADVILDQVSYPSVTTVYGAFAELLFGLAYCLSPGSLLPLKCLILLSYLLIIFVLLSDVPLHRVVLLALCPTMIHSFLINLHIDIIAILFLLLALYELGLIGRRRVSRYWLSGVYLALSLAVKPFAVILLPWLVVKERGKQMWTLWGVMIFVFSALSLPFWLTGGSALISSQSSSQIWAFNNPLYYLLSYLLNADNARILLVTLFFLAVVKLRLANSNLIFSAPIACVFFLICSPVVNAWYLAWVLVIAVYSPIKIWMWVAAISFWLSYASGINFSRGDLALYQIPWVYMILEWCIPFLVFLWETKFFPLLTKKGRQTTAPSNPA